MTELMKESTAKLTEYVGTAEEWRAVNPTIIGTGRRGHTIADKVFTYHTTGTYSVGHNNRVKLLEAMKETLVSPDEIWLNAEKNKSIPNNRIYIKYYDVETITVTTKVVNNKLEIHSWFALHPNAENNSRRGMLIKRATRK